MLNKKLNRSLLKVLYDKMPCKIKGFEEYNNKGIEWNHFSICQKFIVKQFTSRKNSQNFVLYFVV